MTKVDCQYVFGVFTHWDKAVRKSKKKDSVICLESLERNCKQPFLAIVNKSDIETGVFFVDSKHVLDKREVSLLYA